MPPSARLFSAREKYDRNSTRLSCRPWHIIASLLVSFADSSPDCFAVMTWVDFSTSFAPACLISSCSESSCSRAVLMAAPVCSTYFMSASRGNFTAERAPMASSSPESTPVITRIGTQATSTRLSREDWSHQCFATRWASSSSGGFAVRNPVRAV